MRRRHHLCRKRHSAGSRCHNSIVLTATVGGNGGVFFDNLSVTGGVPEPAVWAMMLAGFGLMGAALRRRRGALLAA